MYKVTSRRNGIQTDLGVCNHTIELYKLILNDALDLCEHHETKVTLEKVYGYVFYPLIDKGFPMVFNLGVATYKIDVV